MSDVNCSAEGWPAQVLITSTRTAPPYPLHQRRHQSAAYIVAVPLCFQQACAIGRLLGADSTDPFPGFRFLPLPVPWSVSVFSWPSAQATHQ